MLDRNNRIAMPQRGFPMSDNDRRRARLDRLEPLDQLGFGRWIERGGRLIEDKQARAP
jgi:hypothetical protein